MDDFPEVTYRDRLEHFARGYCSTQSQHGVDAEITSCEGAQRHRAAREAR
jgi:hypothetical protein